MSNLKSAAEGSDFSAFRQRVFADVELQQRLRSVSDFDQFVTLVVEAGRESGFRFAPEEVAAVMKRGQLAWLTGWSPIL